MIKNYLSTLCQELSYSGRLLVPPVQLQRLFLPGDLNSSSEEEAGGRRQRGLATGDLRLLFHFPQPLLGVFTHSTSQVGHDQESVRILDPETPHASSASSDPSRAQLQELPMVITLFLCTRTSTCLLIPQPRGAWGGLGRPEAGERTLCLHLWTVK